MTRKQQLQERIDYLRADKERIEKELGQLEYIVKAMDAQDERFGCEFSDVCNPCGIECRGLPCAQQETWKK